LIESAAQLAESKECDPHEIKSKASYLESEVKGFTAKLKKRRELLKMAVNFYRNSQKVISCYQKYTLTDCFFRRFCPLGSSYEALPVV